MIEPAVFCACRDGLIDQIFSDAEGTPPAPVPEASPEATPGAAMFSGGPTEVPLGGSGEAAALPKPDIKDLKLVREGEDAKAEEEKRLRLRKVSHCCESLFSLGFQ